MIFQERLKYLRTKKGITQEQLANDLNIPATTIRRLETVDSLPRRERLDLIADYFKVSVDYLLGRENKEGETIAESSTPYYLEKELAIKLIEEEAKKLGLSSSDPRFLKMLSDAFEMLRIARGKDSH